MALHIKLSMPELFETIAYARLICLKDERKEIEDRHPWQFYDCSGSFNLSSNNVLTVTPKQ